MAVIARRGVGTATLRENGGVATIFGVRVTNATDEPATVTLESLSPRARHLHVALAHTPLRRGNQDIYFGMGVRTVTIQPTNNGIEFDCWWPEKQNND